MRSSLTTPPAHGAIAIVQFKILPMLPYKSAGILAEASDIGTDARSFHRRWLKRLRVTFNEAILDVTRSQTYAIGP